MTRYAAGQLALALTLTAIGAVKGFRILVDMVDDRISNRTGLT